MVAKKEFWEKRKPESASLSLKKTISISMEEELNHFRSLFSLGGLTQVYKEFLLERANLNEKQFDEKVIKYALSLANIEERNNSLEFRKWLSNKILQNTKTKEQKERWTQYVEKQEYS